MNWGAGLSAALIAEGWETTILASGSFASIRTNLSTPVIQGTGLKLHFALYVVCGTAHKSPMGSRGAVHKPTWEVSHGALDDFSPGTSRGKAAGEGSGADRCRSSARTPPRAELALSRSQFF